MSKGTLKWLTAFTALRKDANPKSAKVRDLLEKSVVFAYDEVALVGGVSFTFVEYQDAKIWRGWVYSGVLEDYIENLPKKSVVGALQTPEPNDAAQFAIYNGIRQTNLCGQISAAYILGVELADLLSKWKQEKPSVWQRVFKPSKTVGTTGIPDVISMFAAFGKPAESLAPKLTDPYLKRTRYTPGTLDAILKTGKAIASVKIDNHGRLQPTGILHWVVLEEVIQERTGYGGVYLYNPFSERGELYPWNEFTVSAGVPFGVFTGL